MISGKYSAIKGFTLGLIIAIIIGDLVYTGYHGTTWVGWFNYIVTAAFGIGTVKMLWDRWKDKD